MITLRFVVSSLLLTVAVLSGGPNTGYSAETRPNVILILMDDLGFGQLSCYGGPIDAPSISSLAEKGLRYNNFHTTGLCSPTLRPPIA